MWKVSPLLCRHFLTCNTEQTEIYTLSFWVGTDWSAIAWNMKKFMGEHLLPHNQSEKHLDARASIQLRKDMFLIRDYFIWFDAIQCNLVHFLTFPSWIKASQFYKSGNTCGYHHTPAFVWFSPCCLTRWHFAVLSVYSSADWQALGKVGQVSAFLENACNIF